MSINANRASGAVNRNRIQLKRLLVLFCALLVCAGVALYVIYRQVTSDDQSSLFDSARQTQAPAPADIAAAGVNSTALPAVKQQTITYDGKTYVKNENIVNMLFLGIDTNASRERRQMGYRSDVVLVCAVDTKSGAATLISLPRDLYTTMYDIDAKSGQVTKTKQNRVNAAFAFGGGPKYFGYENAMACVQMFLQRECKLEASLDFTLDIPVYFYAGIDMEGIAPVAESIGGVEVKMEFSIPDVGKKGDTVLLKGRKAELYLTDRHNTPGADLGRAKKEQDFMLRLAKKIKDMGAADIILNLWDDLEKYVDTNLNTTQMVDFAKILKKVDIDSIQKYTIPGEGRSTDGPYYYYHDEEETLRILLGVYYDEAD